MLSEEKCRDSPTPDRGPSRANGPAPQARGCFDYSEAQICMRPRSRRVEPIHAPVTYIYLKAHIQVGPTRATQANIFSQFVLDAGGKKYVCLRGPRTIMLEYAGRLRKGVRSLTIVTATNGQGMIGISKYLVWCVVPL